MHVIQHTLEAEFGTPLAYAKGVNAIESFSNPAKAPYATAWRSSVCVMCPTEAVRHLRTAKTVRLDAQPRHMLQAIVRHRPAAATQGAG